APEHALGHFFLYLLDIRRFVRQDGGRCKSLVQNRGKEHCRMAKILHSALLETSAHPKEACLFPLEKGGLALFYDQDRRLMTRVSVDRGRTWGAAAPLKTAKGEEIRGNRTSPVRLRSGAIGLFYTHVPHVRRGREIGRASGR